MIGATFVVTIDLASYARAARVVAGEDGWRLLAIAVSLSALLAIGAAAAYATSRPRLRRRWLTVQGVAAVLVIAVLAAWAVANPSDSAFTAGSQLGSLALVTRSFIALTTAFTAIGVIGDVLPAAERAGRRIALTYRPPSSRRERAAAWLGAFADELSPGRARARHAVLAERSRVARDIHADVVPGLRQVLAQAERGMPADRLAVALRDVLADVEAVGGAQHPIQLEIGGLVAALEWLAERVERRSDVRVTLDIDDPSPVVGGGPPAEVTAAAFRVGALALGNVLRHAPASHARVRVAVSADCVDLSVCDDGPGISDEDLAAARAKGRRGIPDMAAEAGACGALLDLEAGPGGSGACVVFRWRASSVG